MNPDDPNIQMVEFIAAALGPLTKELVFVGGCAAGLMITDVGRAAIRATNDVDLITEVAGYAKYHQLTQRLREAKFTEDQDVVCRWNYQGVKVDVMPTDEKILGFSNQWYEAAIQMAEEIALPSTKIIQLISPPLLIATKLDAFNDRGHDDYQGSHDLEDIVSVVDGRPELTEEVMQSDTQVRSFLADEFEGLLGTIEFVNSIAYHLRPDSASQARVPIIIERLRKIAGV